MKKEKIQDFTARITHANRTELVVILYDMLEEYIRQSREYAANEDWNAYQEELKKGQACINQLATSLDMQYAIAQDLMRMYLEMNRAIIHSAIRKDVTLLDGIEICITHVREAFRQLAKEDTSPALMGNAQTVYAGLTYGRGILNENIDLQETSRGFFA